jgi:hypothetical protein
MPFISSTKLHPDFGCNSGMIFVLGPNLQVTPYYSFSVSATILVVNKQVTPNRNSGAWTISYLLAEEYGLSWRFVRLQSVVDLICPSVSQK